MASSGVNKARLGRQLGLLSNRLDDPRRIQLRQSGFLESYHRRDAVDDIVEISHDLTKLQRADGARMRDALALFQQPDMYATEFSQDREYPLQPRLPLPEPVIPDRPFSETVRGRRSCRSFGGSPLALQEMSTLLFAGVGETKRLTIPVEDCDPVEVSFRSIPSGGALHPTHIFAAWLRSVDFEPGIYHYDAPEHELEFVKPLSSSETQLLLNAFPIHPVVVDLTSAAAIFFISSKFWRSRAKYGPRGYRYCLQEAGSACQNLCLAATALDLAHVVLGGFYDDEVHSCLEIDGVDHAVITTVAVGTPPAHPEVEPGHAGF
jgi:SagB-type dehydrogenase family enzyme